MSGQDTASSVVSVGLEIISPIFHNYLSWGSGATGTANDRGDLSQPRLLNGPEAANAGAYGQQMGTAEEYYWFSSDAANLAWWRQYRVLFQFNGGDWENGGDPVAGGQGTPGWGLFYNMSTQFSTYGTPYVNGDVLKFRVSAKT
jgi:hypothetical protein